MSVRAEFVGLDDRRFVTVDVDLTDWTKWASPGNGQSPCFMPCGDPICQDHGCRRVYTAEADRLALDETDLIAASIATYLPLTDAVIRIRVTATEEQWRRVDVPAIEKLCANAGVHRLFGGVQWLPVRESRARVEGFDESLDPADAVARWCAAQEIVADDADALHELTRKWLAEMA